MKSIPWNFFNDYSIGTSIIYAIVAYTFLGALPPWWILLTLAFLPGVLYLTALAMVMLHKIVGVLYQLVAWLYHISHGISARQNHAAADSIDPS